MVNRFAIGSIWFLMLGMTLSAPAQIKLGDDVEMKGGGLLTMGYNAAYGDQIQSNHGLDVGLDTNFSGYYYSPNFLNFDIVPYYNQSHANSEYQSLSNASGVTADANFFTGSHFPGSVSYRYDYNSTGTFGLVGVPNFTEKGTGQGFAINWSALFPDWPTLSVGYSQGSGSGNLYGTNLTTQSDNRTLNLRSSYTLAGFRLSAFYDHLDQHTTLPLFLGAAEANSNGQGQDFGLASSHKLPWNGQFYANYSRSSFSSEYLDQLQSQNSTTSYTTDNETAGVSFHPVKKLTLSASESLTNNLSGYLLQGIINSGFVPPPINLGSGSRSITMGGSASYQFTDNLGGSAQATYYNQHYFGTTYTGTYLSGTVNYNKRLLNTFTFSASVVDSSNGLGNNAMGFIGNLNAFHRIGAWELSGAASYAQNVQSLLITYTTSSYSYSANLHRRFSNRIQWTGAFSGSHSGLTNQAGTANSSEGLSTSLAYKWVSASALYSKSSGNSLLTGAGLVPLPPVPGEFNPALVMFSGHSYGGNLSATPLRRLSLAVTYNRAFSDTLASTIASRNDLELIDFQMRYRLRRIGLMAGYTQFNQGISAAGALPGSVTSYYFGVSRWFDFF